MAKISLCSCLVALSGDVRNTVRRDGHQAVTWPEVDVLMFLHGEDAVTEVEVIGEIDGTVAEEFERLKLRYGERACATLFPGRRPAMLLQAPEDTPRRSGVKAPAKKRVPPAKKAEADETDDAPFEGMADEKL